MFLACLQRCGRTLVLNDSETGASRLLPEMRGTRKAANTLHQHIPARRVLFARWGGCQAGCVARFCQNVQPSKRNVRRVLLFASVRLQKGQDLRGTADQHESPKTLLPDEVSVFAWADQARSWLGCPAQPGVCRTIGFSAPRMMYSPIASVVSRREKKLHEHARILVVRIVLWTLWLREHHNAVDLVEEFIWKAQTVNKWKRNFLSEKNFDRNKPVAGCSQAWQSPGSFLPNYPGHQCGSQTTKQIKILCF